MFNRFALGIVSLIVLVAASQVSAAVVTGSFSGSTSQEQAYVATGGTWIAFGSPTQTGAFSGTFQFDTTGSVDTNPGSSQSLYVVTGSITGLGGTSTGALTLNSTVQGAGPDTFNLFRDVPGSDFRITLGNLLTSTYANGDFVPTVPLNLTGLTSATFTRDTLPASPANGTNGTIRTGTIQNLALTVVPEPGSLMLLVTATLFLFRRHRCD